MIRLLSTVSLAALLLAACTPEAAEPAAVDAVAETASAEAAPPAAPEGFQLSYMLENETYTVQSEIDPAILAFDPALAYRLWTTNKAALDALVAQAQADKAASDADPESFGFMGYSLSITQKAALVLEDVISLADTTDTYTGGAHPNYFLGGGIYRKGETDALPLSTFIADPAAFGELAIKALAMEKQERGYADEPAAIESSLEELLAPTTDAPDVYKGRFVFAPSSEAGKIGGITLVFSPYDIGSYAEGAYEVTLPAAELTPILTEAWAPRFGGAPVASEEAPVAEEQ
ncbi:DUF3298 and DUF4163 domain-containing protein [Hyphomonas sp.]|jgi:hypothetical protein|uniref:DUF3298 and DUF4163 domain-containing protein n=1 Tax=Hyphomonas sp. TaxID=87 RepID=UPI0025C5BF9F|nr:DUF3298 and DUF4163 domain-containing protein [Hyphomonas sp.]MBA4338574.1 hypothetical protein [Hyphomonas sp.]